MPDTFNYPVEIERDEDGRFCRYVSRFRVGSN